VKRALLSGFAGLVLWACRTPTSTAGGEARPARAAGWLKGQLHAHSGNSHDSHTPPEQVAQAYADWGFDFIVFTDHNHVTQLPNSGGLLVFPGAELTTNLQQCDPPPSPGQLCLLHINALFVEAPKAIEQWVPPQGGRRLDIYREELDVVSASGGIAQLNHPNLHWTADAALLTEAVRKGLRLFEVHNGQKEPRNEGDADHPSSEALWDAVLAQGLALYGTATDDAHQYADADEVAAHGQVPLTGNKAWVMVHAERDRKAIVDALGRGDFYATTGVLLSHAGLSADGRWLDVEVDPSSPSAGPHHIDVIVAGRSVASADGRSLRFPLEPVGGQFARAKVVDAEGRTAWVEPVRFVPAAP